MKIDDVELIQHVLDGNDDAFAQLMKKYQKSVQALAWRKIGDFHVAEEITQDTFLIVYKRLHTLKDPRQFAGWIYVIATRRCLAWLRKKRIRTRPLEDAETTRIQRDVYSKHVVEEQARTAVEAQREVVKKLLAKLKESEQTVMTLHYLGEMTVEEISKFIGVSTGTIKSRLRRARNRLQKEETMIREALEHFQISPSLTDNVMQEISRIKPVSPSSSKPLVPWVVAASSVILIVLMFGIGSEYLAHFQEPFNLEANSEVSVDIIETPIMANLVLEPNVKNQLGSEKTKSNNPITVQQPNENLSQSERVQEDGTIKNHSQWELPEFAKARLGKGRITTMQFSPDGSQLAVGTPIGIWLYDVRTGKELHLFTGPCSLLAFSPDGHYLVNGGGTIYWGGEFQVWDTKNFRKVLLDKVPPEPDALKFGESSNTLVSFASGNYKQRTINSISIIDLDTKHVDVRDVKKKFGSPLESGVLYALSQDKVAIARNHSKDKQIEVWDKESEKILYTLNEPEKIDFTTNFFEVIVFSPDGRLLASGSKNAKVRLWDATTGSLLHTLHKDQSDPNDRNNTNLLVFSPDNNLLACGSDETPVQLWDVSTGKSLGTVNPHISKTTALAFSPDSSTFAIASSDGTIKLWDTKTLKPQPLQITDHPAGVYTATVLKDNTTLASIADNGTLTFWDLKTLSKPIIKSESKFRVKGINSGGIWYPYYAFSPDRERIASIHSIRTESIRTEKNRHQLMFTHQIRLTDVNTGEVLKKYDCRLKSISTSVKKVVFSPDGKTIAVGDNGIIHLWNTDNDASKKIYLLDPIKNRLIFHHPYYPLWITRLVFSPNGKMLVSGTVGGKVQMWQVETGIELCSLLEGKWFQEAKKKKDGDFFQHRTKEPITDLVFSTSGDMLAVTSLFNKTHFFKVEDQTRIDEINMSRTDMLVYSPDDSFLVNGLPSGEIDVWDLTTKDKLTTLAGHKNGVNQLVFSADGKTMASIGSEGTILVWDWDEVLKSSPKENH